MNYSTPILSLKVNPDNFLEENDVGFSCNDEFEELKKKLNILLVDLELWDTYSNNAYDFVYKEMNVEINIEIRKKIITFLYKKRKRG